jgi:hypothetical protein
MGACLGTPEPEKPAKAPSPAPTPAPAPLVKVPAAQVPDIAEPVHAVPAVEKKADVGGAAQQNGSSHEPASPEQVHIQPVNPVVQQPAVHAVAPPAISDPGQAPSPPPEPPAPVQTQPSVPAVLDAPPQPVAVSPAQAEAPSTIMSEMGSSGIPIDTWDKAKMVRPVSGVQQHQN